MDVPEDLIWSAGLPGEDFDSFDRYDWGGLRPSFSLSGRARLDASEKVVPLHPVLPLDARSHLRSASDHLGMAPRKEPRVVARLLERSQSASFITHVETLLGISKIVLRH